MNAFTKVISTEFDKALFRVVKFLRYGTKDIQTANESMPFGVDSNPVAKWVAIYAETTDKGEPVIIGYLNPNQLAAPGDTRLFSTDDAGNLKFFAWLKNDGTLELGGNTKNLARFQELKAGFDQLVSDHNDLVDAFNTHVHPTAATGPPSIPTPGTGIPADPSTAEIDDAKIEEIKTL